MVVGFCYFYSVYKDYLISTIVDSKKNVLKLILSIKTI